MYIFICDHIKMAWQIYLKAQKFVWVSFEVKNQNFCLCYAVCCFVSKSDMMFSFDEKKS